MPAGQLLFFYILDMANIRWLDFTLLQHDRYGWYALNSPLQVKLK
jgi:hypothetical protein